MHDNPELIEKLKQAKYLLAFEDNINGEFGVYDNIQVHFPKKIFFKFIKKSY